jgi:hypothetical protein
MKPNLSKLDNLGLKKSGTLINFIPSERRQLNTINLENFQYGSDYYVNLPNPVKRKRYIFGDFVSFVEKVNKLHRLILLKKGLKSTVYKFDDEIKRKYKSLEKKNINYFNFSKYIQNIFAEINLNANYYKRNYQSKLNAYKLCLSTKKYISILIMIKIYDYIQIKNNKAIKIQSNIRKFIAVKKFNNLKKEMTEKAVTIQKNVRRFLIKTKYKEELAIIADNINYNKRQKEYDRKVKIMIKKRNAIRIIEAWWEKILEERRQRELEEKIKKMPIDCQKLYRKFILLRKQTKTIKNEFSEFAKEKLGFMP